MAAELAELERSGRAAESTYADLQHRYEVLGGYTFDQRVDAALSGLGFPRDEWAKPPTALSGGEQTRAALARLVIADPDLLLLDEPTNHLDLDALEWLEDHLRRRAGSLLVASHDRAFLDATVTRIWELRDRRLTVFRGDYRAYHRQREERDARAEKEADTWEEQVVRERELIQRYRSQRKFSKMHEHEARLEKLLAERREAPKKVRKLTLPQGSLVGGGPSRSGEIVVRVEDLAVGYLPGRGAVDEDGRAVADPRVVARAPFLAAQRGDRIGIVGPNGAGKTTLLRTIAGELPPLDGIADVRAQRVARLPRPAARCGHPGRHGHRRPDRGDPDHDRRGPRVPRAVPVPRRRRVQGGPLAVRRRALATGARPARDPAVQPPAPRRTHQPPRHPGPRGDRVIHARVAGHAPRRLPRSPSPGDGLRPPVGRRRRGGRRLRRRLQARGGAAVADGWTVAAEVERVIARRGPAGRTAGAARSGAPHEPARPAPVGVVATPAPASGAGAVATTAAPPARPRAKRGPRLSKDAYRRQKAALDAELTRLGLRKNHLELALGDPAVAANFVELRRVTSELADVDAALAVAEDAWLELEERAPD